MKITTYQEAKTYLEDLIRPSYTQHITGKPDRYHNPLQRMIYLLELLGNPQNTFPAVVVSGTSGKGSTTYLIAHILATAGYKVGMTISPHLTKMTERIQIINAQRELQPITDTRFVQLLNKVAVAIEQIKKTPFGPPSYYEALLALCFVHFAQSQIAIAIVEVGLEGKYDGTQVLSPLAFVYTNTSLDHMQLLGNTVEKIAREGVSAIKKTANNQNQTLSVITGVTQKSVQEIFAKACQKNNAELLLFGRDFFSTFESINTTGEIFSFQNKHKKFIDLHCGLRGAYQITNASVAIETVLQLEKYGFMISEENLREALETANFPGRFEKKGNLILDGAHNAAKMKAFLNSLKKLYPKERKIFLLAFKEDKQITSMMRRILPLADEIVATEYHNTMDWKKNSSEKAEVIAETVSSLGYKKPVYITKDSQRGLQEAQKRAGKKAIIIATGSLYLIGELLTLL